MRLHTLAPADPHPAQPANYSTTPESTASSSRHGTPVALPVLPGQAHLTSGGGRFLLAIAPVVVICCSTEWLLLTGRESFTGLVAFVGAIMSPVSGGIFPLLLRAASRRTGEYVPGRPLRFVSHPIVIAAIYLLFVLNIFLHGLVIWQNPVQRASALIVGVIVLAVPILCLRRGAFSPCAVVEWRTDQNDLARPMFTMTVNGQSAPADVWLRYEDGTQHRMAASGEVQDIRALLSATVDLGTIRVRNVKVWVRRITTTGNAEGLVAPVEVTIGHETRQFDLSRCERPMALLRFPFDPITRRAFLNLLCLFLLPFTDFQKGACLDEVSLLRLVHKQLAAQSLQSNCEKTTAM